MVSNAFSSVKVTLPER